MNTRDRIHHAYWEITMSLFLNTDKLDRETSNFVVAEIYEALCSATESLNLLAKELDIDCVILISKVSDDD